jgi:hypothetical protein
VLVSVVGELLLSSLGPVSVWMSASIGSVREV